jgi:hypothetical protein
MKLTLPTPRWLTLLLLMVASMAFTACSDDDDDGDTEPAVDEQTAAQNIATQALDAENGATKSAFEAVELAEEAAGINKTDSVGCGQSASDTTSFSYSDSASGTSVDFSYFWNYTMQCTNNQYETFDFSYSGNGEVNTAAQGNTTDLTYDYNADGTLDNITSGSEYTYDATYSSDVDYTSTANGQTNSLDATYEVKFTGLTITKSQPRQITGGTAEVTYSGSGNGPNGNGNFNYTATVTFQGNNQAQVVINGNTYNVTI